MKILKKREDQPKPKPIKKKRRILTVNREVSPMHTSTYTTSTLLQRDNMLQTSDKLHSFCEPGSSDYIIPRTFDSVKVQSIHKFGSKAAEYRDNL